MKRLALGFWACESGSLRIVTTADGGLFARSFYQDFWKEAEKLILRRAWHFGELDFESYDRQELGRTVGGST